MQIERITFGFVVEPGLVQRYVTILTFLVFNGTDWNQHTDWLSGEVHECDWFGVECDDSFRITNLNLGINNLVGTVDRVTADTSA